METSGTRQVVDGRLPDSCQSLLIKSVIEMSREAAQEKKHRKKTKEKERLEKPLDQIKYLPGRTAHSTVRRVEGSRHLLADQHLTVSFVVLLCKKRQWLSRTTIGPGHARPDQAEPGRAKSSKEPRHKNQTRNS